MAMLTRVPCAALRPFVRTLWATETSGSDSATPGVGGVRELVLPTGTMHIALRLVDAPLRVFDDLAAPEARAVGTTIVGGARTRFYVRDVSRPVATVGAQLEPGAAAVVLGAPADELASRHTPLDALWGRDVEPMRDALARAPSLELRISLFERMLCARIDPAADLHGAVQRGLRRIARGDSVANAVAESGYSHRRFTTLFRAAVGLAPKQFLRVQRFTAAVAQAHAGGLPFARLAQLAGYSDQAHFARDFREFSGLAPSSYRALSPALVHHVRLPESPERPRLPLPSGWDGTRTRRP